METREQGVNVILYNLSINCTLRNGNIRVKTSDTTNIIVLIVPCGMETP